MLLQFLNNINTKFSNSELLKSVFIKFSLQLFGTGLAFLLGVVIGRLLGASGAGVYYLVLSVISIAAVIARQGFMNTLLRFVASHSYEGDWGQVRGVLRYTLLRSGIMSLALSLAIIVFSSVFEKYIFGVLGLSHVLISIAFAVCSINLMMLSSSALQGLNRVFFSTLVSGVISPFIALVFVWPAIQWFGAVGASISYLAGTITAAVIGLLLCRSSLSGNTLATVVNSDAIKESSRPLWISEFTIRGILPWAPIILLGIWAIPLDVGIYGAATRIAVLISFFLIAINKVIAPKFAVLHKSGDTKKIERLARKFAFLASAIALVAFLIAVFAGERVMSIFGSDFSVGGLVLAILAFGQLANAFTGPVGVILSMGGWEKDVRNASLISAIFVMGLGVSLIPKYGALGAAVATCIGYFIMSFYSGIMVWVRLKIVIVPFFPVTIGRVVR